MKNKTDYFKDLEKFSIRCSNAADKLLQIIDKNEHNDDLNASANCLKTLTDSLRSEYFTPIEREDIYAIATTLNNLYLSLERLNSCAVRMLFFSPEMNILPGLLHSTVKEINNTVKILSQSPKNQIYNSAFNIKDMANKAIDHIRNNHNDDLTLSVKECMTCCSAFSDVIIYIYLKNA